MVPFFRYGVEKGLTNPNEVRLTVLGRIELEKKLAADGYSQREIAKMTGVSQSTVRDDLSRIHSKDGQKLLTPATQTRIENEKKRKAILAEPANIKLKPGFYSGDFRDLAHKIASNSVELILTDPPYDEESIHLYRDAAAVARRILKPGGSFVAYAGQRHLGNVLSECGQYLRYWWTFACVHAGSSQTMNKLGVRVGWKPVVWFVKETRGDVQNITRDMIVCGDQEKDLHDWQQSEEEAKFLIEKLSPENATVVDFFAGSGTTLAAAKVLGRKFIGFERDEHHAELIVERLEAAE